LRALGRSEVVTVALLALLFGAGATVGDVGSCGTTATALDIPEFAAQRKVLDCDKCTQCGFVTQTCERACNPSLPSDVAIPSTCFPLAHDGVVCLDALEATSCGAYAPFVSDTAPTTPSECQFCLDVPDGGP
jgi:hypothetical protein